jgi:murein DD-endopeptidase MepM/ murein hydrolase activator NlpD
MLSIRSTSIRCVIAAATITLSAVLFGLMTGSSQPAANAETAQGAAVKITWVRPDEVSRSFDRTGQRIDLREREADQRARTLSARSGDVVGFTQHVVTKPKPAPRVNAAPSSLVGNKAIGYRLMIQHGFSADQWPALESLWNKESGWNHRADNPSSSAYGIPQALPGSKMSSAGGDWRTNPATQIKWGLDYIAGRYGTPRAAWAHSQATGWY